MRSSFIRNVYIPYHFTIPDIYESRIPKSDPGKRHYTCFCILDSNSHICKICLEASKTVIDTTAGIISEDTLRKLKPIASQECNQHFPDFISCDSHVPNIHKKTKQVNNNMNVSKLTILQFCECLKSRKLSTTGNNKLLKNRLEGSLFSF